MVVTLFSLSDAKFKIIILIFFNRIFIYFSNTRQVKNYHDYSVSRVFCNNKFYPHNCKSAMSRLEPSLAFVQKKKRKPVSLFAILFKITVYSVSYFSSSPPCVITPSLTIKAPLIICGLSLASLWKANSYSSIKPLYKSLDVLLAIALK